MEETLAAKKFVSSLARRGNTTVTVATTAKFRHNPTNPAFHPIHGSRRVSIRNVTAEIPAMMPEKTAGPFTRFEKSPSTTPERIGSRLHIRAEEEKQW